MYQFCSSVEAINMSKNWAQAFTGVMCAIACNAHNPYLRG